MGQITISFKAKRDEFAGGYGYKVPTLKAHHVISSDAGSIVDADLRNGRMAVVDWILRRKLDGYRLPGVVWADVETSRGLSEESIEESAGWSIQPLGNGFMAQVSRTFRW